MTLKSFPPLAALTILCGLALAGWAIGHWDDPPVDTSVKGFHFPAKRQHTQLGIGATLIVMGLTFCMKD